MSKKKRNRTGTTSPKDTGITQAKRDRVAAILAIMIGLLSVVEGGRVLSGLLVPDYPVLPWLVWYNVVVGVVSAAAGTGLWRGRDWSQSLGVNILAFHAIVLVGLFALKQAGQNVAEQSLFAMTFRTFTWIVIYLLVRWRREKL
jgi:hypothetical protein